MTISMTELDARLKRIEDSFALYNLVSSYAPAVDSRADAEAAALWTEDGIYSLSGIGHFQGHDGIQRMLTSEVHLFAMANGGAHVLSMPYLILEGDKAVATNTGRIYIREGERHVGYRVVASRWECVRTPDGWKIKQRYNELFSGSAERARRLIGMRTQWTIDPDFLEAGVK